MKLIMENWRSFSNSNLITEVNIQQAAQAATKNPAEVAKALLANPKISELAGALNKLGKEVRKQPTPSGDSKEEALEEGLSDIVANLKIAFLQTAAGNAQDALKTVGLEKLANVDSKVWGGVILAIAATGAATGSIDDQDFVKFTKTAAKVSTGGLNTLNMNDLEEVIGAAGDLGGGKNI